MADAPIARDNAAAQRFELDTDAGVAVAAYEIGGDAIAFIHTQVPESARGQGVATRLVEAALASARSRGLKVVPRCAAFSAYMQKHPATHDLLAPGASSLLQP